MSGRAAEADIESSAGWSIYLIVLGAVAAAGVAFTVYAVSGRGAEPSMKSSAGWGTHLTVLGALALAGVALTIYDYAGPPSPGTWISLRGIGSTLYWVVFAVFAVASTVTVALFRARLGAPLSYVTALLITVAVAALFWLAIVK